MNEPEPIAPAERMLRVAWISEDQHFIAHYMGEPEVEGFGLTAQEAINMLMERAKQ